MNHSQKSFEERAREMQQREQTKTEKEQAAERERQQQANLIATEGPSKTKQLVEEAIVSVKQRVQAVGAPFTIPEHAQTGALLEVLIREHLLITLRLGSASFDVAVYNLEARGMGRQQSLEHGTFKPDVDTTGNFYWRFRQGGGTAGVNIYAVDISRSPSVKSAKDLADLVLSKAMDLADKSAPGTLSQL